MHCIINDFSMLGISGTVGIPQMSVRYNSAELYPARCSTRFFLKHNYLAIVVLYNGGSKNRSVIVIHNPFLFLCIWRRRDVSFSTPKTNILDLSPLNNGIILLLLCQLFGGG